MIDTVVLTIPVTRKNILTPKRFSPDASALFSPPYYNSYIQCILNATKEQKENGEYFPRLTLSTRAKGGNFQTFLRIEFSVPKLICGNNFQEVSEKDFVKIISQLSYKLFLMGIHLSENELSIASVSSVHYSRNITLEPYISCSMIINQLEKSGNYNGWLDLDKTSFRNGGQILHLHSDRWEFVIYDKLKDLERAKLGNNRSVEKDNYSQLNMFNGISPKQEILRLELRIGSKQKLAYFLREIGCGMKLEAITFIHIFKDHISKELLLLHWNRMLKVVNMPENIKINSGLMEILTAIKMRFPQISDTKMLALSSGVIFIREFGVKAFRDYMHWNNKQSIKWSRFNKMLEKLEMICNNMKILSDITKKI